MFKWIGAVLLSICLVSQTNAEWEDIGNGMFSNLKDARIVPNGFRFYVIRHSIEVARFLDGLLIHVEGKPMQVMDLQVNCKTLTVVTSGITFVDDEGDEILFMYTGDKYKLPLTHYLTSPESTQAIWDMCRYFGFKV